MASITRGSVRHNVHGNFRCLNKKTPVPKKLMVVEPRTKVETPVENHPIAVEEQPEIEVVVEKSEEKSDIGTWKARREKKKKAAE